MCDLQNHVPEILENQAARVIELGIKRGMSSLAEQLAQSASLNVALLVDRSKRKPSESYLFTGREADQHDLDSIYALGTNAFLKLCSVDHR